MDSWFHPAHTRPGRKLGADLSIRAFMWHKMASLGRYPTGVRGVGGARALPPLRTVLERVDPLVEPHVCASCNSRTRCVVFCQEDAEITNFHDGT